MSRARCSAPVLSRGRARTQVISSTSVRVSLELLEKTRRQGCLSARPQVVSSVSGYLEAASSSLEPPDYLERAQDISSAQDISRGRRDNSGLNIARSAHDDSALGPLRMTRSETRHPPSYVPRHCKVWRSLGFSRLQRRHYLQLYKIASSYHCRLWDTNSTHLTTT